MSWFETGSACVVDALNAFTFDSLGDGDVDGTFMITSNGFEGARFSSC